MLHDPIISAADVDPDVVQAISDFRHIAERINTNSQRASKLRSGSRERSAVESQIRSDEDAFRVRAERLGDGWTGQSLLEAVLMDMHRRARRTAQPRIGSSRFHQERVAKTVTDEARAKTALDSAQAVYDAAVSARQAAEHAARHFETRRVTR